jgi:sialate O-acetylesterase
MKKILLTLLVLVLLQDASAQLRIPQIFGDSMVLQRDRPIPVWGWAAKGEKITVRLHDQTKTAVTAADGKWRVNLDAEKAGGPYRLVVKASTQIEYKDVLVGDVWICSGQSNMEWTVANTNNSETEIATAAYPTIRQHKIPNSIAVDPAEDTKAGNGWHSANPAQVGSFTAVGYFFARHLQQELKIPIGLINTSWGGTNVETWTSREAFERSAEFKELYKGIERVNLDSIAATKQKLTQIMVQKKQGSLPAEGAKVDWKDAGYDDGKWPEMKLPGMWESQGLPDLDGIVWLRKTITVTAEQAANEADLLLSMIDDNDETYINGVKLGSTNGYNQKRLYKVPSGVLKEGANTIAIRVEDTGGGGGLYGEAAELVLICKGTKLTLVGNWKFQVASVAQSSTIGPNSFPSLLFNAMVHPLIPYAIKGAIWYQGESNAGRAYQYRKAFPLMINDWRSRWKQGDFPFYFVQLSSFNSANGNSQQGSTWAELREAQTMTLSLPNTGMAVTTDIGNAKDIHPRNKQDVGKRLALVALHHTYGKNVVFSGPVYQSMKVTGKEVTVSFINSEGLRTRGQADILGGFEIAGADQKFYRANARIEGKQVILSATEVATPVAVRYAWADDAGAANLFNQSGLPALPFRTDDWPGITLKGKYQIPGR